MPRRKPAPAGSNHIRRAIASAAARLITESGLDYRAAKRKAASSLGADHGEALPTNDEVEAELRAYQALFLGEEQPELIRELRQAALELMCLLDPFQPRLRGAVLDGTAGKYSPIDLLIFADSSKDVEIFLLTNNISYQTEPIRQQNPDSPETQLILEWDGIGVRIDVYLTARSRSLASNPRNSRYRLSATRAALETLLHAPDAVLPQ